MRAAARAPGRSRCGRSRARRGGRGRTPSEAGVTVSVPASVTVPGSVAVHVAVGASAAERDLTGFVVLTRGTTTRRIPYWFRVERPKLRLDPHGALSRTGTYNGNTAGHPARVTSYRYPDGGAVFGF